MAVPTRSPPRLAPIRRRWPGSIWPTGRSSPSGVGTRGPTGWHAGWPATGWLPEDRVVIAINPDEPLAWLTTYVAVHRAGAVAVPLNTRLAVPELRAILAHAEPAVVLASTTTENGAPWAELVAGVAGLRLAATTGR